MRDWMTTTEVGEAMNVGLGTVRAWIRDGHLKAERLKGMRDWRIYITDFQAFKAIRSK